MKKAFPPLSFQEAYEYLLSFSNLPRREYMTDPRHCGVYLKRVQFLLDILGNPEKKIPHYIHVAGTSGKGSVTSFLHSILQAANKHVGSTYSPHPTVITERWKINGRYMTKKEFTLIITRLKPKLDEYIRQSPYDKLSFFELTEVVGLLWFAQKRVEWLVLETACGGRYDATNVIPHKDIAVITTIGLDHMALLGNTKEKIAYEKAGIIAPGCCVFTMERNKKVLDVITKEARKKKVSVTGLSDQLKIKEISLLGTTFQYGTHIYQLRTVGSHQVRNASLCIDIARSLGISETTIRRGLGRAMQPLRMELVGHHPLIYLDGAHNTDKIRTTVDTIHAIRTQAPRVGKLHLIVGFSADKRVTQMLKQLVSLQPAVIACTRQTTNPFRKVAPPDHLSSAFKKLLPHAEIESFLDPRDAWGWIARRVTPTDIILVTGSIFLSGQLRGRI